MKRKPQKPEMTGEPEEKEENYMSFGMCIGMSLGMTFGMLLDKGPTGMCIGMSIGMCIGMVICTSIKKKPEQEETDDAEN